MSEQRFRILESRALYEIGLPVAVFWVTLVLQLLLSGLGLRVRLGFASADLLVYNAVLAIGGALVWLLALRWTRTEVVLSPGGLSLVAMGVAQWSVPWHQLASWTWDWHWSGFPLGLVIWPKGGLPRRVQLGFLGVGRKVYGVVQPFPQYLPLLKALGYYLQGEQWREPPPKSKKGLWG